MRHLVELGQGRTQQISLPEQLFRLVSVLLDLVVSRVNLQLHFAHEVFILLQNVFGMLQLFRKGLNALSSHFDLF